MRKTKKRAVQKDMSVASSDVLLWDLFPGTCCGYTRHDIPKRYARKVEAMMIVASSLRDSQGLRMLYHLYPVAAYAMLKALEVKDPVKKAMRMIKK